MLQPLLLSHKAHSSYSSWGAHVSFDMPGSSRALLLSCIMHAHTSALA